MPFSSETAVLLSDTFRNKISAYVISFAGSGRRDSRMSGVKGASDDLWGAAGQHGGPAQDGEGAEMIYSRSVIKTKEFIATNMTRCSLLVVQWCWGKAQTWGENNSQEELCQQKQWGED